MANRKCERDSSLLDFFFLGRNYYFPFLFCKQLSVSNFVQEENIFLKKTRKAMLLWLLLWYIATIYTSFCLSHSYLIHFFSIFPLIMRQVYLRDEPTYHLVCRPFSLVFLKITMKRCESFALILIFWLCKRTFFPTNSYKPIFGSSLAIPSYSHFFFLSNFHANHITSFSFNFPTSMFSLIHL